MSFTFFSLFTVMFLLHVTPGHDCTQQVHQALLKQTDNCTVLLISNKMSVVEKAHHIIVLNDGVVQEEGTHEYLIGKSGLYAELVKKQNEGFCRKEEGNNED